MVPGPRCTKALFNFILATAGQVEATFTHIFDGESLYLTMAGKRGNFALTLASSLVINLSSVISAFSLLQVARSTALSFVSSFMALWRPSR
jgi:hypothetical protein